MIHLTTHKLPREAEKQGWCCLPISVGIVHRQRGGRSSPQTAFMDEGIPGAAPSLPHALLKQLPSISLNEEPEHLPGLRAHSPGKGIRWVRAAFLAFHAESKAGCAMGTEVRVGVEVREGMSI